MERGVFVNAERRKGIIGKDRGPRDVLLNVRQIACVWGLGEAFLSTAPWFLVEECRFAVFVDGFASIGGMLNVTRPGFDLRVIGVVAVTCHAPGRRLGRAREWTTLRTCPRDESVDQSAAPRHDGHA